MTKLAGIIALSFYIYSMTGSAQTVRDLHSFNGSDSSQDPFWVTPTQGRDGKLYGTTGGFNDDGSVFRFQTTGAGGQIFAFDGANGATPAGSVTLGTDGNFYGTAAFGGDSNDGVLFKITLAGAYTVLHDFSGGADGMNPIGAPIQADDGNFYGTTEEAAGFVGATVYQYAPSTGTFTTILQLDNASANGILTPLIQGPDRNLYGTAYVGGANGCGSIFKLTTSGTLLTVYSFTCKAGGANPAAPLMQASDGNFYGTTESGSLSGEGTVFRMTPNGVVTVIHTFVPVGNEGQFPDGGLVQATDGNLYGSTSKGGSHGNGTLYMITTGGSYTQLFSFPLSLGQDPFGGLLQHTNGTLYGTVHFGGANGFGAIYSLDMGLGPFVTFVSSTGKRGSAAQILGQGLTGATSVTFNGVPTSFKVLTDTYMTAIVPTGATTGPVVVTTPNGTFTSNKNFRVGP